MLDIEYLTAPSAFKGLLLYRYNSGIMRRRMRRAIDGIALAAGRIVSACDPSDLEEQWSRPGLLECILVSDVSSGHQRAASPSMLKTLGDLAKTLPAQPTAIFVRTTASDSSHIVGNDCIVIDEATVTDRNLESILSYVDATSDLGISGRLMQQPAFKRHFRRWIRQRGTASLLELTKEYDNSVLLYSDHSTGQFTLPMTEGEPGSLSHMVRSLRSFLELNDARSIAELLRAVSVKQSRGWSRRMLSDELCRASQRVLARPATPARGAGKLPRTARNQSDGYQQRVSAMLWSAMLLVWSDQYANKQVPRYSDEADLLVRLDQLCRRVVQRKAAALTGDPLEGLWSCLSDAVAELRNADPETNNCRRDLMNEMQQHGMAPTTKWLTNLQRLMTGEVTRINSRSTDRSSRSASKPPECETISELIGQPAFFREMELRFLSRQHGVPLILCGPRGAGKRTLALVYARALLCEHRAEKSMVPCGHCQSCSTFTHNRGFGYVEIDASHPDALTHARAQIDNLKSGTFSRHRIVVISNPENQVGAIDAFLKSFEKKIKDTTFIVLARDVRVLRAAALSRGTPCRVRPLSEDQCSTLLRRWSQGILNPQVMKLISMESRNLPGPMWAGYQAIRTASAFDDAAAKVALGLDWGEAIARYWRALLGEKDPSSKELELPTAADAKEVVNRNRKLLLQLDPHRSCDDAAFYAFERSISELSEMLTQRAAERSISPIALLRTLTSQWLTDAVIDEESFFELGVASRDAIAGKRRSAITV